MYGTGIGTGVGGGAAMMGVATGSQAMMGFAVLMGAATVWTGVRNLRRRKANQRP